MKKILFLFFDTLDSADRKKFLKYVFVLMLGSVLSVLGIGTVVPFISALLTPEKIMNFPIISGFTYHHVIIILTALLILGFAVKNLTAFFLNNYQSHFLYMLVAKIQKKLFSNYMSFDYSYHLNRKTPNLIKIINNETNIVAGNVILPIGVICTELFSSTFITVFLIYLNPLFTGIIIASLSLSTILFMRCIRHGLKKQGNNRANAWLEMTDCLMSGFSGIKETKLYHCELFFVDNFLKQADKLKLAQAYLNTWSPAPRYFLEFIGLTVVMTLLCIFVLTGHDTKTMFVLLGVFAVAASQILPSMNRLTQALVQIRYGLPALIEIHQELILSDQAPKNNTFKKNNLLLMPFEKLITLKNISYSYADGTCALNGTTLSIPKGKRVALVGASGAGKTTLVDLIMGLYRSKSGDFFVDDYLLKTDADFASFQKLFGYIPQQIQLFDKTILENIAFGLDKSEIDCDHAWQCLEMAQLKNFVMELKDKEESFVGEGGVRLSGGQRQRLGIARALYRRPKILVMDEATSALDNNTEKSITDVVLNLKEITILTIAHRLTTIQNYDLIYVLDKGRVISSGNFNMLSSDCDYFRRMLFLDEHTIIDDIVACN